MDRLDSQIATLKDTIKTSPNLYDKLIATDMLRSAYLITEDVDSASKIAKDFISEGTLFVKKSDVDIEERNVIYKRLFDAYVTLAPNDFHSYLIALEWDRDPKDKFYQPRIRVLKSIVDDMTAMMVEDKYDMMFLSMPPGTGKSTLGLFFLSWVVGRDPVMQNLAIGYSTPMAATFHQRVQSIDESEDYNYHKIFPNLHRIYTSAKDLKLDFSTTRGDVPHPFPSLMSASIFGSLTGRGRCTGVLYCDDLVEGMETAMSPLRLDKLWDVYITNARSRKKGGCKELHIGTRWSINDPIGRLHTQYADKPRCKVISMPALDENDQSLFDYDFGVGFSTQMFHDLRALSNDIQWRALYMQQPMEAEGLLFPVDALNLFDSDDINIQHNPPDDIFSFCDVAFGGQDYLAMPIMAQWGHDPPKMIDCIFMRGSYEITQPVVIAKIREWGVQRAVFEANNGGDFYAKDIKNMLQEQGISCYINTQKAPTRMSKEARIIQHSPAILSFSFLKQECYIGKGDKFRPQYRDFMQNLVTYTAQGNNEHDDAPDSLAGVASILRVNLRATIKILDKAGI